MPTMPKQLPFKASVTELRYCRRCPRLFAFHLLGKANIWKIGLKGTSFCGKVFHDNIAAPFHHDVAGQNGMEKRREILELFKNNANNPVALKNELLALIDKNYYMPFLFKENKNYTALQFESLGDCIAKWNDFLVNFFSSNSGFHDNRHTEEKLPLLLTLHWIT